MSQTIYDVLGIGNALVDVIVSVDEAFIQQEGLRKGTMQLMDEARADYLYRRAPAGVETGGGAAANTLAGLASLGGRTAFIGLVADDALGRIYRADMLATGIAFTTPPITGGLPTGRCLSLVTPDAERTMNTYLGAATDLGPDNIDIDLIETAAITYLEGFLFNAPANQAAFHKAAQAARRAGRQVALSLSDLFCVEGHRAELRALIEMSVDLLFANEAEICSLYETDFASATALVRERVGTACLTSGPAGSLIVQGGMTVEVPAFPGAVVDTTGAGDLYAAGFLYGYTQGLSLEESGEIAAIAAAEVISHPGARPLVSLRELIAVTSIAPSRA